MARYIVLLQNKGFSAKNAKELLERARSLVNDDTVILRDTRVSSKNIEFDIGAAGEQLDLLLKKLSIIAPIATYNEIVDKVIEKDHAIEYGKSLFNNERYWECHEALEGVWRNTSGNEKELLQGMILVSAAFVHSQKDEDDTCLSILDRALEKLQNAKGIYYGIDTDRFKRLIANIIATKSIQYFRI
ncbi:MAG: DUF309 domain-containing protein [Nitrososphaerales archaeon]